MYFMQQPFTVKFCIRSDMNVTVKLLTVTTGSFSIFPHTMEVIGYGQLFGF